MPTAGELARLELARRFRLEADFPDALSFEQRLDPRIVATPALRLLSAKLTPALRPRSRARLILSVPPQEGKTTLTRAGVLRELGVHPDQRFVLRPTAWTSRGTPPARSATTWCSTPVGSASGPSAAGRPSRAGAWSGSPAVCRPPRPARRWSASPQTR